MENNLTQDTEEKENRDAKFVQSVWAYALLSWLMATFPPMMVLPNLYGGGTIDETTTRNMLIMLIGFCSFAGAMGGLFIGLLMAAGRRDQLLAMGFAPLFGGIWGIVIGGIGGFPIFFIGGIILGWIFAVPFGVVGFTLFAVVYESLAARRRLSWWQTILIVSGVASLLLIGIFLWQNH